MGIALPGNTSVVKKEKEKEKKDKYRELAFEIRRLWNVKTEKVIPVIGVLDTISMIRIAYLAKVSMSFETIQKTAILGTAYTEESPFLEEPK